MKQRVNLFVTCIGDVAKANMAKKTVLLLEKLGCEVIFPSDQTCCGQPSINSGFAAESIPIAKSIIEALEINNDPIVAPAGSCVHAITKYPYMFSEDDPWRKRAQAVADRIYDLTYFIVRKLGVTDVGARLPGKAVYHPSCSLFRKLGVVEEPIMLLQNVKDLTLLPIQEQTTCCGFGGTFSVKMSEISGEMVKEKVEHILDVVPDYVIGADSSCLINIEGRLSKIQQAQAIKVMHIVDVLVTDEELAAVGY